MKKSFFVFILFSILLNSFLLAQENQKSNFKRSRIDSILEDKENSVEPETQKDNIIKKANTNTAIRCFKLAENCLIGKDWNNALARAELGLSYDNSISDLIYIQAAAKINLGATKAEVIEIISDAFEKNNWVGYSKNGARILYADLLCDTGKYKESFDVLDNEPFIYSADAEIIRIKNYYRIGTEESYNQARLKINSSRRVYPSDFRFENIFFNYELYNFLSCKMLNGSYEIPELVQIIADSYLAKFPDYSNSYANIEIMAAYFAEPDLQKRLASSIYARNQYEYPLFSLLGLKNGILTEQQAFDLFIKNSGEGTDATFDLLVLESLAAEFNDKNVQNQLANYLNEYEGVVYLDKNKDLQQELVVKYSLGRPSEIFYDYDMDGKVDFSVVCDYGTPVTVSYSNPAVNVVYNQFPEVKTIDFVERNIVFNFLYDDYIFAPVKMVKDVYIKLENFDFYLPEIEESIKKVTVSDLVNATASIELPIDERPDGKIVYTMLNGELTFAKFYEGNREYAYCDFEEGLPFIRFADYDGDGNYETFETYDVYDSNNKVSYDDNELIVNIFSKIADNQNIYLKEVQIDRNLNTFFEYSEIFIGNNGRICLWDYDDNGLCDVKYTKYQITENANENDLNDSQSSVFEETVFYSEFNGELVPKVVLNVIDDVPLKLIYEGSEVMIFAGENKNFYWLENKPEIKDVQLHLEESILAENSSYEGMQHGAVSIIEFEDNRMLVIKVFDNIFCTYIYE